MPLLYDLAPMQELNGYTRAVANDADLQQFRLSQFLPNDSTVNGGLSFKVNKARLADQNSASFRAWDTPAPIASRQGLTQIMGEIAPISLKIRVGEEESLRLRAMETGNMGPLIDTIYDDAGNLARAVAARIERARGEALVNATLTISENGFVQTVDFGRDASMSWSAGTVWSNTAASTPLTEERTKMQVYIDLNGYAPGIVLMSSARVGNLLLNAEYRALASSGGTTPSILTNDQVNAIRRSFDLAPIFVYDTKVMVDGVSTRVIGADKVIWMPPANIKFGSTLYGTTAEAVELVGARQLNRDQAIGMTAVVDKSFDPVSTWTKVSAVSLPVLVDPNGVMVGDVA